jgi:hypothetical protein
MHLQIKDDLPFISVIVAYQGSTTEIPNVLVDTGSATSILSADAVSKVDLIPAPEDILYTIRGVGSSEAVFSRQVDYLHVGEKQVPNFQIEVGGMDYGFDINGILVMDFLTQAGAVIDLNKIDITFVR